MCIVKCNHSIYYIPNNRCNSLNNRFYGIQGIFNRCLDSVFIFDEWGEKQVCYIPSEFSHQLGKSHEQI